MRVMITGATGFIGGHTAALAVKAGHEVRALVRSTERLEHTMSGFDLPVPDHVVGDMTDPAAVAAALDGADAVIHCAAVVSLDPRDNAEMIEKNVAGARTVLEQAVEMGLDPVVHVSSTAALFEPEAGPLTVDHPPSSVDFAYCRAKSQAEVAARGLQTAGAPVAIVYPSGVVGPAAGTAFGETGVGMARFIASGAIPTRTAAVSITDVRDLAAVLVALLEPGQGPRRIMCGGHFLDMDRLAGIYRELTGRRFPIAPVPPAALRGMGRVLDTVRRVVPFQSAMNEEGMTITTYWEGTADSDLASLGVELRDPEDSFADSLIAWHAAGLLTRRQTGDALVDPDPSEAPAPPKGFRASGRVLTSRPFRAIGPHVFPPFHRAVNQLTRGRTLLDSAAQPMLMLTTTGAKTGKLRETPLAAVPLEEGRFVLVGSNFAREHHPAWSANLIANPDAEIVFHGERTPVRARLLEGAEREQRWQTALAWFPAWARYDAVTERDLRLFELQPVTGPPGEQRSST